MTYLLALDQGTSSSRSIVFDRDGRIVAHRAAGIHADLSAARLGRARPDGDLGTASSATAREVLAKAGHHGRGHRRHRHHQPARDHRALGPRDRPAGAPRHRLAGPPRRPICARLRERRHGRHHPRQDRPGDRRLLLGHQAALAARQRARRARRGRARRAGLRHRRQLADLAAHRRQACTSPTSATPRARMLFDIARNAGTPSCWRCSTFPPSLLPRGARRRARTSRDTDAGAARRAAARSPASPATSRAPSSARPASRPGMAKNTYGTGCFLLMHTGGAFQPSHNGLLDDQRRADRRARRSTRWKAACSSAARWCSGCATACKAIQGSARGGGAGRERARRRRRDMVPAFTGLGAPYWDADARGTITGLTRGTTVGAHRARRAGKHRLPERRAAAGHEPRRGGGRRRAGGRTARRRRRLPSTTC